MSMAAIPTSTICSSSRRSSSISEKRKAILQKIQQMVLRAHDLRADLAAGLHQRRRAAGRGIRVRADPGLRLYRSLRGHHDQERVAVHCREVSASAIWRHRQSARSSIRCKAPLQREPLKEGRCYELSPNSWPTIKQAASTDAPRSACACRARPRSRRPRASASAAAGGSADLGHPRFDGTDLVRPGRNAGASSRRSWCFTRCTTRW